VRTGHAFDRGEGSPELKRCRRLVCLEQRLEQSGLDKGKEKAHKAVTGTVPDTAL
jgi:hypothetical protein